MQGPDPPPPLFKGPKCLGGVGVKDCTWAPSMGYPHVQKHPPSKEARGLSVDGEGAVVNLPRAEGRTNTQRGPTRDIAPLPIPRGVSLALGGLQRTLGTAEENQKRREEAAAGPRGSARR